MRVAFLSLLLCFSCSLHAATGKVVKVLPHFLDSEGRVALSPSLFERDAYQAYLRAKPDKRAGIRYSVQWKARGTVWEPLVLRVELRGTADGALPKRKEIQTTVEQKRWLTKWTHLDVTGEEYKEFGEVTAWRVTLWEGSELLAEQRSFLW